MVELSLAPMLKVTTPTFRNLMGLLSPNVILFTEMIVSNTVVNVSEEKLLYLLGPPNAQTIVQIGGSNPKNIAEAIKRLVGLGWKIFNLNCGCPSKRVQKGMFGAILMHKQDLVAEIINEVYDCTGIVLSLKIRTGVDDMDSYEFFSGFINFISNQTKCMHFYVHARKCWLNGVSPKHNRNVPKLNYDFVYQIKTERPDLKIFLNGGVRDTANINNLDGVMIGRHAVENINIFNQLLEDSSDECLYKLKFAIQSYLQIADMLPYSRLQILLPLNNLQKGKAYNRHFRQVLNELINSTVGFNEVFEKIKEFI